MNSYMAEGYMQGITCKNSPPIYFKFRLITISYLPPKLRKYSDILERRNCGIALDALRYTPLV